VADIGKQARNEAWVRLYKETLGSEDKPMLDHPGLVELPWGAGPAVLVALEGAGFEQWLAHADRLLIEHGWNLELV
jgi:hypothetical protein